MRKSIYACISFLAASAVMVSMSGCGCGVSGSEADLKELPKPDAEQSKPVTDEDLKNLPGTIDMRGG